MRYIKRDVIVDAFQIVSVGPEVVPAIGQPAVVECELSNGTKVKLHAGHTGFTTVAVGDYCLTDGTYMQKDAFERTYLKEFYGGSDQQDTESIT